MGRAAVNVYPWVSYLGISRPNTQPTIMYMQLYYRFPSSSIKADAAYHSTQEQLKQHGFRLRISRILHLAFSIKAPICIREGMAQVKLLISKSDRGISSWAE